MEILKNLNKNQTKAATSTNKRLQIIAGAGTGKTHTLIARIAYITEIMGVNPLNILLITFTNKAAEEMKERADKETDGKCKDVTAMTFHAFCAKELRELAPFNPRYQNFTICDTSEAKQFFDLVCQRNADILQPLKDKVPKNIPISPKTLINILSTRINTNISIEDIIKKRDYSEDCLPYIKTAINLYIEEKKKNNIFDFDDLLLEFVRLLNKYPKFQTKMQEKYRYILVDEHQDSNNLQNRLIQLLTGPNTFLTVVGDEFQSIYRFRGANVEHFMQFGKNYMSDIDIKPETIALEENYRSTQEILDLGNSVTRNSDFGAPKHLTGFTTGAKPALYTPDNEYRAGDLAFSLVSDYMAKGPIDEIAVLGRNASHLAFLESHLNIAKIPYEKRGGPKFFEQDHIQDAIAFQKLCLNPYDQISWFRILKLMKDIGSKRAQDITDTCHTEDFLIHTTYEKQKTKTDKSIHGQLFELHNKMNAFKEETHPSIQLQNIIEYLTNLYKKQVEIQKEKNQDDRAEDYQRKIANLDVDGEILLNILESNNCSSLNEWLDLITLNPTAKEDGDDKGKLILSTIHSAKGLEWDHVILINATENALPYEKVLQLERKDPAEFKLQLQEEQRLFYVAVTRPRYTLDVIAPELDRNYKHTDISRFIASSRNCFERKY